MWVGAHQNDWGGHVGVLVGMPLVCMLKMSSSVEQVQAAPPRGVSITSLLSKSGRNKGGARHTMNTPGSALAELCRSYCILAAMKMAISTPLLHWKISSENWEY